jgi:hypothetical protein
MWVPPAIKDPILQNAPTRKSVACFGAVSLGSGQFVRMMCPIFNAAPFRTFLRRLLRQQTPGRRMIVVLDNARCRHGKLLAHFLISTPDGCGCCSCRATACNWRRSSEYGS